MGRQWNRTLSYVRLPYSSRQRKCNPALIQTKTTLNPGTFTTLPVTAVALNQANFDAIKNQRTNRLYIWGKMNYTDVFGCKRWFTYCLTINDLTSPPPTR